MSGAINCTRPNTGCIVAAQSQRDTEVGAFSPSESHT